MGEIKVSIVMPVLNVRDYIRECLDSAVGQTLKEIEIICVDAYSTDGTREIIEEYVKKDSRVKLLDDDKGSTGYANNIGIRYAAGEYMAILEPDDYVAPNMYANLYAAGTTEDCDMVKADYQVFWGTGDKRIFLSKPAARKRELYGKVISAKKDKELFLNDMSTWAGIYKKDFLVRHHISHNETPGASYQDNGFWFQTIAMAERMMYLPISGYRYRLDNPGSSVRNSGKVFAICDEFTFIRKRLEEERLFQTYQSVFVYMKYIRYMGSFYRLHESLKAQFLERFSIEMNAHQENGDLNWELFSDEQKGILKEILISPEKFAEHVICRQQRLKDFLEKSEKVIQFGCGSDGIRFLSCLREHGWIEKIAGIADNNPKLQKGSFMGIPLMSPKEARKRFSGYGYIVTSLNYEAEIKKQLRESGVPEEQIMINCLC